MAEITNDKKRARDADSVDETESDSPEAKRIRDDLLDILDDSEPEATPDLASVMKSFEEEILSLPSSNESLTSDSGESQPSESGESQPDLGYLFEASDDELGLPPAEDSNAKKQQEENENGYVSNDAASGFDEIWRFEDEIPSYDFGIGENSNGEFLALDGLFDYSDVYSGQSDFSDFLYRPESLPAL